jgi:DNA-binding MarR family transcriptional regulator
MAVYVCRYPVMNITPASKVKMGRPPLDRQELLKALHALPRRGRGVVRVNERVLAVKLGWDRGTVARGIDDLEASGSVRRMKSLGHRGLLVALRRAQ